MTHADPDTRVRDRAYQIWKQEGCPEGRASVHWDMARELVAIEENQHLATKPNPQRGDIRRDPTTGEPVEPLMVVTNQGEFPTLTDQGEEQSYPQPRRPAARREQRTAATPRHFQQGAARP